MTNARQTDGEEYSSIAERMADLRVLFFGNCADPNLMITDAPGHQSKRRYQMEIYQILSDLCKNVIGTADPEDLYNRRADYDFVFSLYNRMGFRSCEVYPSSVCEFLKVPYLGAQPEIRAIAENKSLYKYIAKSCGIEVPDSVSFDPGDEIIKPDHFFGPYFVKPQGGANSEHIRSESYCEDWPAAKKEIKYILSKSLTTLVEEFVGDINLTVAFLGGANARMVGVVEVPTTEQNNVLTSLEKQQQHSDMNYHIFTDRNVVDILDKQAHALYQTIKPVDYFRLDYRYDTNTEKLLNLEVNVCCDISSFGSFAFAAEQNGMSHADLVNEILEISLSRQL